jgi:hypothetical protein
LEECGPCPVLASYILAFAFQPRKKHGKTSVRVAASKNTLTTIGPFKILMYFRHIICPTVARSTYGGEERDVQGFGAGTLKYIGVDGSIILKWMWEVG